MTPMDSGGGLREERRGQERGERRVNEASSFSDARARSSRSPARTYSHSTYMESRAAWDDGDFSAEWKPWRHKAAMECGIIFPPNGTSLDSWEDARPTQRAILIRAIRETPTLLTRAMKGATSWSQIVDRLMLARDRVRAEQRASEVRQPADEEPLRPQEAAVSLKRILDRIGES